MTEAHYSNPFRIALAIIAAAGIAVGIILILVGNSMASDYLSRTNGSAQTAWGIALAGLGSSSLLLWLVASAITWRPSAPQPYVDPAAAWAETKPTID